MIYQKGSSCGSNGKEYACNAGDLGSIPGLGSYPGEGNGYPLQYSGLENSMDSVVQGVANSRTGLSDFHFGVKLRFSLQLNIGCISLENYLTSKTPSFHLQDRNNNTPLPMVRVKWGNLCETSGPVSVHQEGLQIHRCY